jgi:hypothetical protein
MSQYEIAEKAGISQQMVSSITAKVAITSLNSHSPDFQSGTRYGFYQYVRFRQSFRLGLISVVRLYVFFDFVSAGLRRV